MSRPDDTQTALQNAEAIFFQPLIEKNRWLTRIRWIYPFFILLFLFIRPPSSPLIQPVSLLSLLLPLAGNVYFSLNFRRQVKNITIHSDYGKMKRHTAIQLDFDLLAIFLILYFFKQLGTPLINLFFVYIFLSPFLVDHGRALRSLVMAVLLLVAGMMGQKGALALQSQEITYLLTLILLFFFTFSISTFLSLNLQKNEALLQKLLRHTHELSISDGLTGLYNQTYFFETLENENKFSLRHKHNYSLVMFDVDFFKNYNDHNGHLHGSAALKRIAQIMRKVFRTTDFLAKYGGDEFVIILPLTEKIGAYLAAERFREAVEQEPFPGAEHQPQGKITVSLGIASFPEHSQNSEEIIELADKCLYLAKDAGRNRTVIYHEGMETDEEE